MATLKLHRHVLSGHCHRVELFISLLGLDVQLVDVDLARGAHKRADFLARNRFGQVPVLEDGDTVVADSNAILVYLALRYSQDGPWYPADPALSAEVQRFLSIAAGPMANGPAAARLVNVFDAALDHDRAVAIARDLLKVLDEHLKGRDWLVGKTPTLADIANYAYIAHAPEGGVSLKPYPAVRTWLERIEDLPGFIAMPSTTVGLVETVSET